MSHADPPEAYFPSSQHFPHTHHRNTCSPVFGELSPTLLLQPHPFPSSLTPPFPPPSPPLVLHYNLTTASNLRGLASGHQPLTIHLSCTLTNVFTLQPHFNPCPSPQVQHRAPLPTLSKLQAFALGPGLSHLTAPWPLGGGASGGGGWEAGDWPWGDKDPFGLMLVRGVFRRDEQG